VKAKVLRNWRRFMEGSVSLEEAGSQASALVHATVYAPLGGRTGRGLI
jgi:hypothetical protein